MQVWTFSGDQIYRTEVVNSDEWSGRLVESGSVVVDFVAGGREASARAAIRVVPRPSFFWTVGNGMSYDPGGLAFPAGDPAIGKLCHPTEGCGSLKLIQPSSPSHGNGYVHEVVNSGPNQGAWYVESTSISLSMASGYNPEYRAGGIQRPQVCGTLQSVSFWEHNQLTGPGCGGGGPSWGGWWLDWTGTHEEIHATNVFWFVAMNVGWNVPAAIEGIARSSSTSLQAEVAAITAAAAECVQFAGARHWGNYGLASLPGPDRDIDFWGASGFYTYPSSQGAWWVADAPFPLTCF